MNYKIIEEEIKQKKLIIKEKIREVNELESQITNKKDAETLLKPIFKIQKDVKKIVTALYTCYPNVVNNALKAIEK